MKLKFASFLFFVYFTTIRCDAQQVKNFYLKGGDDDIVYLKKRKNRKVMK